MKTIQHFMHVIQICSLILKLDYDSVLAVELFECKLHETKPGQVSFANIRA